jgi:hypothetical protein
LEDEGGVRWWGMRTKVEIVAIFAIFDCGIGYLGELLKCCGIVMYCTIMELGLSKW